MRHAALPVLLPAFHLEHLIGPMCLNTYLITMYGIAVLHPVLRRYMKATFREYTDGNFTTLKNRTEEDAYLGIVGAEPRFCFLCLPCLPTSALSGHCRCCAPLRLPHAWHAYDCTASAQPKANAIK